MGQLEKNLFNSTEIEEIRKQPSVDGVSPLISNRFQVELSAGNIIPFSTSLFLESLDDEFLDTLPPNFKWKPGQEFLPMIVSSDFLQMYNVFAPGYGLPQVSEATASQIKIFITCTGVNGAQQTFRGSIVAFSDRINSIIVPKDFLVWGNNVFSHNTEVKAARLYVKMKDANNPAFISFLDKHQYRINKDKVKFVLDVVKSTGGIDYAARKMLSFRDEALKILYEFEASEARHALEDLVRYTTDRSY